MGAQRPGCPAACWSFARLDGPDRAPAGTPKEIVTRLNAEVLKALGDGEVRRKLEELGFAVRGSSPDQLRSITRDQLAKYARVIKETGIAIE